MEVFKTVPISDLDKIKKHGLASLMYQIENGLSSEEISDKAEIDDIAYLRANCIFFGLMKYETSKNTIQLMYDVDPVSTFVYNSDYANGTLAPLDPKYLDSKMTLAEFLKRSENYSHFLLESLTALPLGINPTEFWEKRKSNPGHCKFYNPEILIYKQVIPFSELRIINKTSQTK